MEQPAPRVLVVGAGPAGLATSAALGGLAISYRIVDRTGVAGGAYRKMHSRMRLSSPARFLRLSGLPLGFSSSHLTAEQYAGYLTDYAVLHQIQPLRREVGWIERVSSGFAVQFRGERETERYPAVVVCTGTFDNANMPSIDGLDEMGGAATPRITYSHSRDWKGAESFTEGTLLIVGSGMTAVELAEECVQAGGRPIVSSRSGRPRALPSRILGIDPRHFVYPLMSALPIRLFEHQCTVGWKFPAIDLGFAAYCRQGLITLRGGLTGVEGDIALFADGSRSRVNHIVFATGYRWHMPFLPAWLPRGHEGNPRVRRGQSPHWPGLFFVGTACAFNAGSQFVYGMVEDARRVALLVAAHLGMEGGASAVAPSAQGS